MPGGAFDVALAGRTAYVAAGSGGRYISHIRSEDRWLEAAVDEIIAIANAAEPQLRELVMGVLERESQRSSKA